jgi:YHS domain-containing protein
MPVPSTNTLHKNMKKLLCLALAISGVASAAPANKTCPVGSRPARADITSTYQGKEIAFCCNKCKAKFDAEPAKYAGNVK